MSYSLNGPTKPSNSDDTLVSFTINLTRVKKSLFKIAAYAMVVSLAIGPTTPIGVVLAQEVVEEPEITETIVEVVEESPEENPAEEPTDDGSDTSTESSSEEEGLEESTESEESATEEPVEESDSEESSMEDAEEEVEEEESPGIIESLITVFSGAALPDFDNDGIPDDTDLDDDNDGVTDVQEGDCVVDTDTDGSPDCRDLDSDNDGVWDLIEGNDSDFDGHNDMGDHLDDADYNGQIDDDEFEDLAPTDGLHDDYAITPAVQQDTDSDVLIDRKDPDDDNDIFLTKLEDNNSNSRWYDDDEDCDGRPDYLDAIYNEPGCDEGNTPPTITLVGDNPFSFAKGGTFNDPRATADDVEDGNLTGSIVVSGDTVDENTVGTYTVIYTVTDSGSLSASTTRTVIVEEGGCTSNCGGGGGGGGGVVPVPDPEEPEVLGTTTVTYDLFIINPDGTERHMGTPFVSTLDVNDSHAFIGFEDSGSDFDHNDVVLQAVVNDCNLDITAIGVYADWNHGVGIRLLDGASVLMDTIIWGDTQGITGEKVSVGRSTLCVSGPERIGLGGLQDTVTVNIADFVAGSCSAFDYSLSIINPDGTVRATGSDFVQVSEDGDTRTFRFEDRGDDNDFNDVVIVVTRNGCQIVGQISSVNAGWHHQVRMQLIDAATGAEAIELVLWENSQEAIKNIPRTDTDGDGIPDYVERFLGTDPLKKDTDGDGYNDLEELLNGFSPLMRDGKRLGDSQEQVVQ